MPQNKMRATHLLKHDRNSEIPVATEEEPRISHRKTRKATRFPPQCEMRPDSPAATGEQSRVNSSQLEGMVDSLLVTE